MNEIYIAQRQSGKTMMRSINLAIVNLIDKKGFKQSDKDLLIKIGFRKGGEWNKQDAITFLKHAKKALYAKMYSGK